MPHDLLSTLEHRSDLWTIRHVRERIERRPYAFQRITNGLPDSPADLRHGVGELGVPVIPHSRIISLAKTPSQSTLTQLRRSPARVPWSASYPSSPPPVPSAEFNGIRQREEPV